MKNQGYDPEDEEDEDLLGILIDRGLIREKGTYEVSIPYASYHADFILLKKLPKPPKPRFKPNQLLFLSKQGKTELGKRQVLPGLYRVRYRFRLAAQPHEWYWCIESEKDYDGENDREGELQYGPEDGFVHPTDVGYYFHFLPRKSSFIISNKELLQCGAQVTSEVLPGQKVVPYQEQEHQDDLEGLVVETRLLE